MDCYCPSRQEGDICYNIEKITVINMRYILLCMVSLCLVGCNNESTDYSGYMKSQSLIWEEMPLQWNEAAFTGNGHVGQMAYVDTTDNSVTLWLGRTDVTDHRGAPDRKSSLGVRGANHR